MTREVVHRIPHRGSEVMPCCGRAPWDLPGLRTAAGSWIDPAGVWHRPTANSYEVTCGRPVGDDR